MNNVETELESLERELELLIPVAPRSEMQQHLTAELEPGTRKRWPVILAVAAALCVGLGIAFQQSSSTDYVDDKQVATIDWQPVQNTPGIVNALPRITTERLLVNRQDEGVIHLDGIGPVRKVRLQTLTRSAFDHPEIGRSVSVTTPEEKVVFVRLQNQL